MFRKYLRGQVWMCNSEEEWNGHIESRHRPIIIVSNDIGNYHSPTIVAVPCTGKEKRTDLPTHHVFKNTDNGVVNTALCEQAFGVNKDQLIYYMGQLDIEEMSHIDECLMEVFGIGKTIQLPNNDCVFVVVDKDTVNRNDQYDDSIYSPDVEKLKLIQDVDDLGFEKTAKIYKLSQSTVKTYYYKYKRELRNESSKTKESSQDE